MPFNVCFTCAHYDDMRCVKKRYGVSSHTVACSDYMPDEEAFVQRDKAAKEQPARAAWSAYTSGSPIGDIAVRLGMTIKQAQELVEEGHKLAAADAGVEMSVTAKPSPHDSDLSDDRMYGLDRETCEAITSTFDATGSVNKAAKAAGVSWGLAKRILDESGRETQAKGQKRRPAPRPAAKPTDKPAPAPASEPASEPTLSAVEFHQQLLADLKETERIIAVVRVLVDEYDHVPPEILRSVMDVYRQRRREVA